MMTVINRSSLLYTPTEQKHRTWFIWQRNSDSDRTVNTTVGAMVINEEDQAWCKVHKIPIRKVSSDYYVSVFTTYLGWECL
jgi:hypothetical protein